MKLLEYEAKNILKQFDITIPEGMVVKSSDPLPPVPTVVKSQVPVGGRGKAGGVKVVKEANELPGVIDKILNLSIKGYTPSAVLCEELLDINNEYYLSLVINRSKSCIEVVAHGKGGIEIESHDASEFYRHEITKDTVDGVGQGLADYLNLPSQTFALQDLLERLLTCFIKSDATLLEINPLVLTQQDKLVAGDCKMTLDNAAAYRHKDWDFEDKIVSANFVTLDTNGTVATIANGAGLAMATVDAVKTAGLQPANFLDIGGNATVDNVVASFEKIMEFPKVDAIVINIFGGIVRCDNVAQAIIEARDRLPHLPALYIRLSGNRSHEASELLREHGLTLYESLEECIKELAR